MDYGFSRKPGCSFDRARERIEEALAAEGFGVLTEIDLQATLRKKLDVDFRRYVILGACNPPFAHQALSRDLAVGLLMPCNVILYEDDEGDVVVAGLNVEAVMGSAAPPLADLAASIDAKLRAALARL